MSLKEIAQWASVIVAFVAMVLYGFDKKQEATYWLVFAIYLWV